ncbi:MAG: hypothetical protein GTN70_10405 [Deltaproteobacteria bacterium]|nr:hypothetical protein [Deltaproteobacteria bacterium]NIS78101.1 hypothetical protein [Deltaproteobacteria bacterium]
MLKRSSIVLLLTMMMVIFLLSVSTELMALECNASNIEKNKCFVTANGYTMKIVDTGFCEDNQGVVHEITSFPHKLGGDRLLWCYEAISTETKGGGNLSQVDLQVPVDLIDPPPGRIDIDSSGQIFSYSSANGCSGDSTTGYMIGAKLECAIKWVFKLNPGGNVNRFSFETTGPVKTGVQEMAPKIGSDLWPGFILAAGGDAAFSIQSITDFMIIEGLLIRFGRDTNQCITSASQCTNPASATDPADCTQWTELTPVDVDFDVTDGEGEPIPGGSGLLRRISFLGGNQVCDEAYLTIGDNTCVWIPNGAGGWYPIGDTCP